MVRIDLTTPPQCVKKNLEKNVVKVLCCDKTIVTAHRQVTFPLCLSALVRRQILVPGADGSLKLGAGLGL